MGGAQPASGYLMRKLKNLALYQLIESSLPPMQTDAPRSTNSHSSLTRINTNLTD
jgi:hypothetical protein